MNLTTVLASNTCRDQLRVNVHLKSNISFISSLAHLFFVSRFLSFAFAAAASYSYFYCCVAMLVQMRVVFIRLVYLSCHSKNECIPLKWRLLPVSISVNRYIYIYFACSFTLSHFGLSSSSKFLLLFRWPL